MPPARPAPGDATHPGTPPRVRVTLVESEACHFCADAHEVLEQAAASHPLEVETLDVRTPEGQALMQLHRATMSPLVLVDGRFFSHGRLPRRKLAALLGQRYAAGAAASVDGGDGRG